MHYPSGFCCYNVKYKYFHFFTNILPSLFWQLLLLCVRLYNFLPPVGVQWWHCKNHSDGHERWRRPSREQESQQHGEGFLYSGKNLRYLWLSLTLSLITMQGNVDVDGPFFFYFSKWSEYSRGSKWKSPGSGRSKPSLPSESISTSEIRLNSVNDLQQIESNCSGKRAVDICHRLSLMCCYTSKC